MIFFSLGIPANYQGRSNKQIKGSCDKMYKSRQERVRKQRSLIFQDLSKSEKVHVYQEICQHLIYTCEKTPSIEGATTRRFALDAMGYKVSSAIPGIAVCIG